MTDEANFEVETRPLDDLTEQEKGIRHKLLHILDVYPFLSHTMIQMGLGPSTPAHIWKPVLFSMLARGEITRLHKAAHTPKDRVQMYTIYTKYPEHYKFFMQLGAPAPKEMGV